MPDARILLAFLLCCVLCAFQRACCDLKTQTWTLISDDVKLPEMCSCQNCILNVAGAMRATIIHMDKAKNAYKNVKYSVTAYKNVKYSVTASDFAFMSIHSKCVLDGYCSAFELVHSSTPSGFSTESSNLVATEQEAAKSEPMCFILGPQKTTARNRLCLKEVSGSELLNEYPVASSYDRITRTIVSLYPKNHKTDPKLLLLACMGFGDLKVDPSNYVSPDSCQNLIMKTLVFSPLTIKKPLISRSMFKTDSPSTSSGNSWERAIQLEGIPLCILVTFAPGSKVSECMTTFFENFNGEAVFLGKKLEYHYFYLFGSKKNKSVFSFKKPCATIKKADLEECKAFHSHHYDTSSVQRQILSWKTQESEKVILHGFPSHQTRCAVAQHRKDAIDCQRCVQHFGNHVIANTMTDSTFLVSLPDKFDESILATCIKDVYVRNDATKCSHFVFLPREMCEYARMKTSAKSPSGASSSNQAQPNVMVVTWEVLNIGCLQDIALYHDVLLVSKTDRYLWMLRVTSDELRKRCKEVRIEKEYFFDVHFLRSISAFDMKKFIGPT
ncbi:unnamed protein product [Albugo candida]|uniref:Uncharacterized protein n=1 Tax=Albugo candida TaxID=65357 RepID=A0A024GUG6_9STRA|nr:unnamed protein product [Albugo candida]|eukprot:CCI49983.1 unnamed protein product [Albugo candida]